MKFKILFLLGTLGVLLCACTKDPLPSTEGKVLLTTDWSQRTDGVTIPDAYTVRLGEKTITLYETTMKSAESFQVGVYRMFIYHTPDNISIVGNVATVAIESKKLSTIQATPGWLFTGVAEVKVTSGWTNKVSVTMQQQIRQLTLAIKPQGGIASQIQSIDATLSGITPSWDFDTNQPVGTPVNVRPLFAKQSDGTWLATVRLLGVSGTQQQLSTLITFADQHIQPLSITSDLSTPLRDFNLLSDAKTPMTLQTEMTVSEAGFSGTINDWSSVVDNGTIQAN